MACNFGFSPAECAPYYFLSYNREDCDHVAQIARSLLTAELPMWYDQGLIYGEEWEPEIARRIMECQAVILFFTKQLLFKKAPYTQKEYRMAIQNFKKPVYVVELDHILPEDVPYDKVPWWDDIQSRHIIKAADLTDADQIATRILNAVTDSTPDYPAVHTAIHEPVVAYPDPPRSKGDPVNPVVSAIMAPIWSRQEDRIKLTEDYEGLCLRYFKTKNLVQFDNSGKPDENYVLKQYGKKAFVFPVTLDHPLSGLSVEILDNHNKKYTAPSYVSACFEELLAAHRQSTIYNNLNIRADDWYVSDGRLYVKTSRTTYYDSLTTNRVMDYKLSSGTTIRDVFEYKPQISALKQSALSNHIGFNGFVESCDGYIPFVKRDPKVSIGKRTLGTSVAASLKTKYALDAEDKFSLGGLFEAIRREIEDELCIDPSTLEPFDETNHHLIAAYRDLVEGGKPQFLFYVKTTLSMQQIEDRFRADSKAKLKHMVTDGTQLMWLHRQELDKLCLTPDALIHKGVASKMVPSTVASVVMLLNHLQSQN